MAFQLPQTTWCCLEDAIKACLAHLHTNQIYLDCHRDACWDEKEVTTQRCGVNLFINTEQVNPNIPTDYIGEGRTPRCMNYIAQMVIQVFCLMCEENDAKALRRARQVYTLVLKTIMDCWKKPGSHMRWDTLTPGAGTLSTLSDVRESNRVYSVHESQLLLGYRMDPCKPEQIIERPCLPARPETAERSPTTIAQLSEQQIGTHRPRRRGPRTGSFIQSHV